MTDVALTRIVHGNGDQTRVVIEQGDKVTGLDAKTIKLLKEQGAIGEPVVGPADKDEEKAQLLTKIEQLQKELAEANKPKEPVK